MFKKFISHLERLNMPYVCTSVISASDREVFVKEQIEFDGRIISRTTTKTSNPRPILAKFKASDFSIENLTAIGATDHFRPIGPICSNDIDTSLLSLDSVMDLVDSLDSKRASSLDSSSDKSLTPETPKENV